MSKKFLKRINYFFLYSFIFILCLGNLQRIQLPNNLAFYIHDVIIAAWLSFTTLTQPRWLILLKLQISSFKHQRLLVIFLITQLLTYSITLISGISLLIPLLYLARLNFYALFAYQLYYLSHSLILNPKSLNFSALSFGFFLLVFGFLQYAFLPDTRFLSVYGWDDHYYRLVSTLLDPNFTGIILVLTFLNLQAIKPQSFNHSVMKSSGFLFFILNLSFLIGILLTYSRASYLSFLVGLTSLTALKLKSLTIKPFSPSAINIILSFSLWILVLGSGILVLPHPGGEGTNLLRTSSIEARQTSASQSLSVLAPHQLLIGQGLFVTSKTNPILDSFNPDFIPNHSTQPVSSWLAIFLGTGAIGSSLIIILFWKLVKSLYQKKSFLLLSQHF